MLSHQNVILFPLFVNLDLIVQILDIVIFDLLTFLISDTLCVRDIIHSLLNLIGIELIMVPIHLPLVLLFFHLEAKSQVCIVSITLLHLRLPLNVPKVFGFPLGHVLEHELLISLRSFVIVALRLVVA